MTNPNPTETAAPRWIPAASKPGGLVFGDVVRPNESPTEYAILGHDGDPAFDTYVLAEKDSHPLDSLLSADVNDLLVRIDPPAQLPESTNGEVTLREFVEANRRRDAECAKLKGSEWDAARFAFDKLREEHNEWMETFINELPDSEKAKEGADCLIVSLLGMMRLVDDPVAVLIEKFNETSDKYGSDVKLPLPAQLPESTDGALAVRDEWRRCIALLDEKAEQATANAQSERNFLPHTEDAGEAHDVEQVIRKHEANAKWYKNAARMIENNPPTPTEAADGE